MPDLTCSQDEADCAAAGRPGAPSPPIPRPVDWPEIAALRTELGARRTQLANGLRELGFTVVEHGRGGLFLHPDLSPITEDPEGFVLDLEKHARVRLNTPTWSATPTHARACYAMPQADITEALSRLRTNLRSHADDNA